MLFLSYLHFFALVSYLYLAAYLLAQKPRTPINRYCIGFLLCLALWSLQFTMIYRPGSTEATVRFWMNLGSLGWLAMGYCFLGFALYYTGQLPNSKSRWFHGYLLAVLIPLAANQWRGEIVDIFIRTPYGWTFAYVRTFWTLAALLFISTTFSLALYHLYRFAVTRRRRAESVQGFRLFAFTLVSVVLATHLNINSAPVQNHPSAAHRQPDHPDLGRLADPHLDSIQVPEHHPGHCRRKHPGHHGRHALFMCSRGCHRHRESSRL